MSKEKLLRVLRSYSITVPKHWRELHELTYKGKVKYEIKDGQLRLIPTKIFTDKDNTLDLLELWRITLPEGWRDENNITIGSVVKAVWDGEGALIIIPVIVSVQERVIL